MTEFVLCGTGWRADFYRRIALSFPKLFSIVAIYTRNEDRAKSLRAIGEFATTDLSEALSREHKAVIVASGKEGFLPLLQDLEKRGETILSETTFSSLNEQELIQVEAISGYALEQYWFTPLYGAIEASLPFIGRISSVYLSALHMHHAASICRRIFPSSTVISNKTLLEQDSMICSTGSRYGLGRKLEKVSCRRTIKLVELEEGVFINDFTSGQYHHYIIPSRIEIRGETGTITEKGVTYVNKDGYPIELPFIFWRDSDHVNQAPTLSHVSLGEQVVYENEFYPSSFNDDEIAIAKMLKLFGEGKLKYTIVEGVKDARLGRLL